MEEVKYNINNKYHSIIGTQIQLVPDKLKFPDEHGKRGAGQINV